jgi:hypothetical protein
VQGDANLSNIGVGINNVLPGGTINLAWQNGVNDTTSQFGNTVLDQKQRLQLIRLGVKGGVMENWLTYRAEYLQDMGEQGYGSGKQKYEGSAIDLGVGLNLKETPAGKFGVAVNYAMASGNDQTNPSADKDKSFHDLSYVSGTNVSDRYFGEIFGKDNALNKGSVSGGQGLNQTQQGAGLKVLNLGVKYVPPKWDGKVSAMADYYMLNTDKKVNSIPAGSTSDKIGNELDLTLAYAYSANVNISGGYAMLSPDKALQSITANPKDNVTEWFSRMNVKWGGEEK